MKSDSQKAFNVVSAKRVEGDGMASLIADDLIAVGRQPTHLLVESPVPESAGVVFSLVPSVVF
jgi:hypothetical protein